MVPRAVSFIAVVLLAACGSDTEPVDAPLDTEAPPAVVAVPSAVTTMADIGPDSTAVATTQPVSPTTTIDPAPTTTIPPPTTALPAGEPARLSVAALAWGLFCRDLEPLGFGYADAVAYWIVEGEPARMDADRDGIPCETVYPTDEVVAFWGAPLPTGGSPGTGSGWRLSQYVPAATPACCDANHTGPTSPPLPPPTGPFPDDGAYAASITRVEGRYDQLVVTIRRWVPCSEVPDWCSTPFGTDDVAADPDAFVVRSFDLDERLIVVIHAIPLVEGEKWTNRIIEGDGSALARLLGRIDTAVSRWVVPSYEAHSNSWGATEHDLLERGAADLTFPYGPAIVFETTSDAPVFGYRGPEGTHLTPGFYHILEQEDWMFDWWATLEIIDGKPVLFLDAGQIAG